MRFQDLTGKRFGHVVVQSRCDGDRNGKTKWICLCDCGNKKPTYASELRRGRGVSCGYGCPYYPLQIPPSKYVWFNYRGSAKRKNLPFTLTVEQLTSIISQPCDYCGRLPSQPMSPSQTRKHPSYETFRYNGIDRVDSARGYVDGNVVPCCKPCNEMKSDKSSEEFLELVKAVYNHSIGKAQTASRARN